MFTREKIPKHHRLLSRMGLQEDLFNTSLYGSSHLREIFLLDIQNNFETDIYKPKELIKQLDNIVIEVGEKRRNLLIESIDSGYEISRKFSLLKHSTNPLDNTFSYLLCPFISKNIFSLLKPNYLAIQQLVNKFLDNKEKEKIKEEIVESILKFIKLAIGWNEEKDRNPLPYIKGGESIETYYDYVANNSFISSLTDIFDFNNRTIKVSKWSDGTEYKTINYKLTDHWYSDDINQFSIKVVSIIRGIYLKYIPMENILESEDDPNILILPKDFRLEKGGIFKRGEPDERNNVYDDFNASHKKSAYFTTSIMTTLGYLTDRNKIYYGSQDYCSNLGEIHVFRVRHNIRLLNLSNINNVKYLGEKLKELEAPEDVIDAFKIGWVIKEEDGTEKFSRQSYYSKDYLVVNWLCENGFNGYLATHTLGLSDEIVICDPSRNLKYMLKHTSVDFNVPLCEEPYNDINILMTDV
jgi:hypothetical protein